MSKICCIENGVVSPKASSCSMILRSACSHCSHGHSHRNSSVKEHSSTSYKRKHNSSITSKSPKNGYSLLNGHFHESFESNHKTDQKVLEVSSSIVSCVKELHFSQLSLSDSQDSYLLKNSNHAECSSDYCSATESDVNSSESLKVISDMNTRRYTRTPPYPTVRSLSDSEGESDITVERISRLTRKAVSTNHNAKEHLYNNVVHAGNHSYSTNSHSNKYTSTPDSNTAHSFMTDSSHFDTSSVQCSLIDRIRLFLWNCTYVNIIRYMNLDLRLLSSINSFRRVNLIPILLLPLLLLLVWGAYVSSSSSSEVLSPVTSLVSTVISSFLSFLSSIFSFVGILFTRERTEDRILESSDEAGFFSFLPSLSSFGALFSGLFSSAIVETRYDSEKQNHDLKEKIISVQISDSVSRSSTEELMDLSKVKDDLKGLKSFAQQIEADRLMYQKIHKDISDLHSKFEILSNTLNTKEKDIERYQKEKSNSDEKIIAITNEYKSQVDILKNNLKILENKLSAYEELKKCCRKNEDLAAIIERNIILAFKEVLDGDVNSKYNFFSDWLNSKFFNHEKLMQEINTSLKEHKSSYTEATVDFSKVMKVVEGTVMKHVDALKRNLSEFNSYSYSTYSEDYFSEDKIRKIVKQAIMLYDADKIGQVDYALESGGGSVLGTRCSETYVEKYGKISLFGVPFWTYSNSPRTAIQPDVQPGRCWAFKGSQGFLVLQLSATIYPTGFTLEHIPVSLSPAGTIDSAPKNFSVWGLDSEKDNKGNLLGEYFYDINGDPLQYFDVKIPSSKPYSYIELQIHSNHGNMEYTCLYRFRVHGKRAY